MSLLSDIGTGFSLWIDAVAGLVKEVFERFEPTRRIELVEEEDGTFTIESTVRQPEETRNPIFALEVLQRWRSKRDKIQLSEGPPPARVHIVDGLVEDLPPEWGAQLRDAQVELALQPSRFLFRPLDLPKRASEFLEGIVRAQIDRLTPWSANDAVYHWTRPVEIAGDRIAMTIVASARSVIAPLANAFADLGAAGVTVSTHTPGAVPVTVYQERAQTAAGLGRIRKVVLVTFLATGCAAAVSIVASDFLGAGYDDQLTQVQRRIADRRAVIRSGQGAGNSAVALLERRKQTTPSSVLVLEALSALLPDHTYATELNIEGDKLQISGITHDAPSLISILEQSPHFTHATFFAPTTHSSNDPGERFHIEAKIRPYFKIGT
jgi:general secretion pathway protein L